MRPSLDLAARGRQKPFTLSTSVLRLKHKIVKYMGTLFKLRSRNVVIQPQMEPNDPWSPLFPTKSLLILSTN